MGSDFVRIGIDNVFGSKWLVNELFRLGFYISYDEVVRYKQIVIASENAEDIISSQKHGENNLTQFVAGKVDHDIANFTGNSTHFMEWPCSS